MATRGPSGQRRRLGLSSSAVFPRGLPFRVHDIIALHLAENCLTVFRADPFRRSCCPGPILKERLPSPETALGELMALV